MALYLVPLALATGQRPALAQESGAVLDPTTAVKLTGPERALRQAYGSARGAAGNSRPLYVANLDPERSAPGKLAKNRRCKSPTGQGLASHPDPE
jgi:hypothetical protein